MHVMLDATDMAKLSPDARAEIYRLFAFADGPREVMAGIAAATSESQPKTSDTDERGLINLTPALAAQLIKGVNSKSRGVLRWLAESPSQELELLFPQEPDYKDSASFKREFIGPVNRRLRTITNNRSAELFYIYMTDSKEVDSAEYQESFVYVSKQTAASLRSVLNLRVVDSSINPSQ